MSKREANLEQPASNDTPKHIKRSSSRKKTTQQLDAYQKQIEQLTNEVKELKDKYLRTAAEFDNYKKRRERELGDLISRANEEFCLELLPIIDDFERSLNSQPKKRSYQALKQGIQFIYQKLMAALKKQGVEPIAAVGQPFDPQFHSAIMQVEDKSKPSNVVVDEAVKGYRFKDKLLRYSQVVVNK
ncbi:MAG: nucleotide exchange factor GrpE [candidate division KSB1 bacterium]|nr:nucleotide exchange factor GrpE [candidate division KSB1 bacterium]MDZ7340506.1 nucleotide exchange factor GrpE [candidate division KSB1 bacterium]